MENLEMPSTWKRNPEHQPLHCSFERHMKNQYLALAIYSKARTLTAGDERPFYTNQTTLAKFFNAHPNSIGNAMNFLRKNGWLVPTEKENEYRCISHDDWVKESAKACKPSLCIERKIARRIRQSEEAA
jgi:hypothetical protein